VTFAIESEVERGAAAYVTLRHLGAEGDSLELPAGDRITCEGRRLEKTVEAWTSVTYYKAVMPEVRAGESYAFAFARASGDTYDASVVMPSEVLVDPEASDREVQPGRDVQVAVSAGSADELEVSVVAECLAPVSVTVEGDAVTARVPGDRIECACAAGGRVPPCDGLIRAQRIDRGPVDDAFAGGESLGVQRHEVDVSVIEE
jgi:hypothetical protein